MVKALKLPGTTTFNLQDIKRDSLKGNASAAALAKTENFGVAWHGFNPALQDDIVNKLLNESSESALVAWLQTNTGVSEVAAETNCKYQPARRIR